MLLCRPGNRMFYNKVCVLGRAHSWRLLWPCFYCIFDLHVPYPPIRYVSLSAPAPLERMNEPCSPRTDQTRGAFFEEILEKTFFGPVLDLVFQTWCLLRLTVFCLEFPTGLDRFNALGCNSGTTGGSLSVSRRRGACKTHWLETGRVCR